jgi:hypothetical protein
MHPDKLVYQRGVFTYFDFLAEIGGLVGILSQIAEFFLKVIGLFSPFNSLDRSLTKKIFWLSKKKRSSGPG